MKASQSISGEMETVHSEDKEAGGQLLALNTEQMSSDAFSP